ncbi:DUF5689 domain-containing protein [Flavobacterium okayamense]|uniref:DUF5689 domain-containing protein n=1 Tax=Flavobacterium okayamense TaxID=2830782 RepID=A0ABN6HT64_9FLAO|nr:DUF5689 domain-containing protein [Flavobacterium okayamense]BCY27763.1 hypothetical protein KK2020170_06310 [Flavobacterium okayamense]
MKNIKLLLSTAILTSLTACVNGDDYNTPDLTGECVTMTSTIDVQDVTSVASSTPTQYISNDVIEAYVTSSDEGGNFYKSISLVSTDEQQGFTIPVDSYNLYTKFEPGRLVYINMENLYYAYDSQTSSYEIGNLYEGTQIGRLSGVEFENIILRSCTKVDEEDIMVSNMSINDITANNSYMHKLIELDNVQFTDASLGMTYYDTDLNSFGGATNHEITDEFGNTIIVRVSEFATFAGNEIPSGSGKIRGVLTKYNSDFQFMVRTLNDIDLNNTRMDIDFYPPLVGSSVSYVSTLNEPFTSYSTNTQNFPAYINDAAIGSRYWQVRAFSGNQYIQMSSFGGTPEENRSLFIVPVDMTAASTLSFKTKAGFNNGAPLKVYYSTDYVIGTQITTATLVDITSNFTIDAGPTSGYSTNFVNSGVYNIPAGITGNGVFIFEYTGNGNGGVTTTMQIDDILIN